MLGRIPGKRPRYRALTLGELILLNRLRADEHIRRALALTGANGLRPHDHRGPPEVIRRAVMPRVGFAGLKTYTGAAKARLDQEADKRADRIDAIAQRGMDTLGKYDKHFDGIDSQIEDMDAMVREGSNGPPLPES